MNFNRNIFKLGVLDMFEIFPSDPFGSLDDFCFKFFNFRGAYYE